MMELREIVPVPEDLLSLEVEELAGVLLMHLNSGGALHHYNFFNHLRAQPVYPGNDSVLNEKINRALMEAWDWLANEGFIAIRADDSSKSQIFITRRGQRMKSRDDFRAYYRANVLPKGHIHPVIASRVYPAFLRG